VEKPDGNKRFLLRAYEYSNSCRLAAILVELGAGTVERAAVIERWRALHPQHLLGTGKNSIRGRITKSLSLMRAAGIVEADETIIKVLDADKLAIAAGNLPLVVDANDVALKPSEWTTRPAVPEELLEIQALLMASLAEQQAAVRHD